MEEEKIRNGEQDDDMLEQGESVSADELHADSDDGVHGVSA